MKNDFDLTKKLGTRLQSCARVMLEGRALIPSAVSREESTKLGFFFLTANTGEKDEGRVQRRQHANDNENDAESDHAAPPGGVDKPGESLTPSPDPLLLGVAKQPGEELTVKITSFDAVGLNPDTGTVFLMFKTDGEDLSLPIPMKAAEALIPHLQHVLIDFHRKTGAAVPATAIGKAGAKPDPMTGGVTLVLETTTGVQYFWTLQRQLSEDLSRHILALPKSDGAEFGRA